MRMTIVLPVLLGAVCLSSGAARAQTVQRFSIQASGLFAGVFGEENEGLEDGAGFEVQARYTPGAFSVGVGFQFTSHGFHFAPEDSSFIVDDRVGLYGAFIEPRYVISIGSNTAAPYLAARLSLLTQRLSTEGPIPVGAQTGTLSFETSGSGPTINGGGGVLIRLGSRANLDLGVTYGYTDFGDFKATGRVREPVSGLDEQSADQASGGTGSNVIVRLGLAFGLGG